MVHPYWPLFDLEVRTPQLTLRYVDDELATDLATAAARGVHDPGFMPFSIPWTRFDSPMLERRALQYAWRCRAELGDENWNLPFAVVVEGRAVGISSIEAHDFVRFRQFETGSWLGREHQGRGIGTEMRIATLTLGFVGLGAEWASTTAWHDNGPSLAITRSLGYAEQGHRRAVRDDERTDVLLQFEMSRSHFVDRLQRDDIEIVGLDAAREQLGFSD